MPPLRHSECHAYTHSFHKLASTSLVDGISSHSSTSLMLTSVLYAPSLCSIATTTCHPCPYTTTRTSNLGYLKVLLAPQVVALWSPHPLCAYPKKEGRKQVMSVHLANRNPKKLKETFKRQVSILLSPQDLWA
jgi:hypothetical protein